MECFEAMFLNVGCGCMIYCGETCRSIDWDPCVTSVNYHQDYCERMKTYLERKTVLCDFPFTFTPEVTNDSFDEEQKVFFLQRHGVLGKGWWRWESNVRHVCNGNISNDNRCNDERWALPMETSLLTLPPTTSALVSLTQPLRNWKEFYSFRNIPLDSPVAVLLSYAMTLYFVLTTCLPQDEPALHRRLLSGQIFVVHVVGVEREVDMKETFLQCTRLLPASKLHLVMVGRSIGKAADKLMWSQENVTMSVVRSTYHLNTNLGHCHLAIAFNAGLPAYATWPPTLMKLQKDSTPTYFTDQSEFSYFLAASGAPKLGLPAMSPAMINPFRGPLRIVADEHNMPLFPNAFLFHLLYPDT